jgi:hypothetical protein
MEQKIIMITEAFSMQPNYYAIVKEPSKSKPEYSCKEIILEKIEIDGEYLDFYCGYNFEGLKIFQFLAKTVNVSFGYV